MPSRSSAARARQAADPSEGLSRREAGKAERRRRIIEAARELIRETGDVGLSMRALAARAGVSLATPYNLFGSKRAIILALLEDVRAFQERFRAVRSVDPLERLFAGLDLAVGFYIGDPAFYKMLWSAVFDTKDDVRGQVLSLKANAFWRQLIDAAVDAGALHRDVDPELLCTHLLHIFRSVMLDWAVGDLPCNRVAPTMQAGAAMLLAGCAAPDWRGPLHARLLACQAALKRR